MQAAKVMLKRFVSNDYLKDITSLNFLK